MPETIIPCRNALQKKSYKFYLNKVVSTDEVAIFSKFACQLHLIEMKQPSGGIVCKVWNEVNKLCKQSHLMVAKEGFVDDHNQGFSKTQHLKARSCSSMRYHKVCTFHILKSTQVIKVFTVHQLELTDTSASEGL